MIKRDTVLCTPIQRPTPPILGTLKIIFHIIKFNDRTRIAIALRVENIVSELHRCRCGVEMDTQGLDGLSCHR